MHKGDIVIAEHPDSRANQAVRSYGIVQEVLNAGSVIIKMADGSTIERQISSIAVFVQPPSNWQELYQKQVILCPPKRRGMFQSSNPRQRQN